MSRWKIKIISCKICKTPFETYLVKSGVCKKCQKKINDRNHYLKYRKRLILAQKIWKLNNPDKYKERNKKYYLKNKEKISRLSKQHYLLTSTHVPKEIYLSTIRKEFKDWTTNYTTHPKKKARLLLQRAVRKGIIKKPKQCSCCHKKYPRRFIEGHHINYDEWWKVVWLCSICHKLIHLHSSTKGVKYAKTNVHD